MKSLKQQIQEKYLIDKDTVDPNIPKVGEIAWDYNGEAWKILDYCEITNKADLKNLIKNYDHSGLFKESIKYLNKTDKFVVAAENENCNIALWVWGFDGICYENK